MEKNFLDEYIKKSDPTAVKGSHKAKQKPWYNPHGDCIEFQAVDEEIIADRIDNFLTIYQSATNREPIGFQIKDVQKLMQKYECTGIEVQAKLSQGKLINVTGLLLFAYEHQPPSINRRSGYTSALSALPSRTDQVSLPLSK